MYAPFYKQTVLSKDKVVQVMKRFLRRYRTALQDFKSNITHSHSLAGIEWTVSFYLFIYLFIFIYLFAL